MRDSLPDEVREPWSEAKVNIRVDVSPTGEVLRAEIERPSGYADFDEMALGFTQHMRFEPATRNGRPVRASLSLPMSFSNVPLPAELSTKR